MTVWTPPQRVRDDRELIRARLETGESCTRVKLQIFSMLKRRGIALPDWFRKNRGWTKRFVKWLETQAETMDEAVQVARECPGVVNSGSAVEVREISSP